MRYVLCVILVSAFCVSAGEPAPAAPGSLTLTTERVVIFKDGYGLFVKKASAVADTDGRVFTQQVPDGAVLGCFWATSNNKVLAMRAEWDERNDERATETPCISTVEILRANKGKTVKLSVAYNATTINTVAGVLQDVLDLLPDKKDPALRAAASAELAALSVSHFGGHSGALAIEEPSKEIVKELVPRGGQLVTIDTVDQGRLVLPVSDVRSVSGQDLLTKMMRRELVMSRTKRLSFEMGKDNAGKNVELQLFYFSEGVRWIPTYRVAAGNADKPDKADISLQGEILNEAEDIRGAALDLVVGVPNFRFKTTPSPLALE